MGILLLGAIGPYEGPVATRLTYSGTNGGPDVTNVYVQSRSPHVAAEALTSIRIVIPNFGADVGGGGFDAGSGGVTNVLGVGIEHGTTTRVQFSGSNTGTIANKSVLFSDYVTVNIPKGDTFYIRMYVNSPSGTYSNPWQYTAGGESFNSSATSQSDLSQSTGTFTSSSSSQSFGPVAILGMTINPSVIILGDSIAEGFPHGADNLSITDYKQGLIATSLGSIPSINLGMGGAVAYQWPTLNTARSQLLQKASHIICNFGVNDLRNGAQNTSAQLIANLQLIVNLKASWQKFYETTITPMSSDPGTPVAAFTTIGQQTAVAGIQRVAFNTALRNGTTGITGLTGFYEVAWALENSHDSGLWLITAASGSAPYTPDGIHPFNNAETVLANSGAINLATITYP